MHVAVAVVIDTVYGKTQSLKQHNNLIGTLIIYLVVAIKEYLNSKKTTIHSRPHLTIVTITSHLLKDLYEESLV